MSARASRPAAPRGAAGRWQGRAPYPRARPPHPTPTFTSRARNKIHARTSRARKKAIISSLQHQSSVLEMEGNALAALHLTTFELPFARSTLPTLDTSVFDDAAPEEELQATRQRQPDISKEDRDARK